MDISIGEKEYIPAEDLGIEKETNGVEMEISKLVSDEDWKNVINFLRGRKKDYLDHFLKEAAFIRKFNPNKFDKEIQISDEEWDWLARDVDDQYDVRFSLEILEDLNDLNSQRFKEKKVGDKFLLEIINLLKKLEEEKRVDELFVFYDKAFNIFGEALVDNFSLTDDNWDSFNDFCNERPEDGDAIFSHIANEIDKEKAKKYQRKVKRKDFETYKKKITSCLKLKSGSYISAFGLIYGLRNVDVEEGG